MKEESKSDKFHANHPFETKVRWEVLSNGKGIGFAILSNDLVSLQFNRSIDFDGESDEILKKFSTSEINRLFEYRLGSGFEEVALDQQNWFKF